MRAGAAAHEGVFEDDPISQLEGIAAVPRIRGSSHRAAARRGRDIRAEEIPVEAGSTAGVGARLVSPVSFLARTAPC